jgi:hypothetical protein
MKTLSVILSLCVCGAAGAQTIPAPPYYPAPSPAYNYPQQNQGTPMVKNPVENNNPSVQASIPILNKPSGLEADSYGIPYAQARTVYNNVQQNTPAKNTATEGRANLPSVPALVNVSSDTIMQVHSSTTTQPAASAIVKTTVIYNNTTGTDISTTTDKTTQINSNTSNTYPVRQTYISETVVSRFKTLYGESLYDIRQVRYSGNNTIYIIRTMKGGLFTTMFLNENGEVVPQ